MFRVLIYSYGYYYEEYIFIGNNVFQWYVFNINYIFYY